MLDINHDRKDRILLSILSLQRLGDRRCTFSSQKEDEKAFAELFARTGQSLVILDE